MNEISIKKASPPSGFHLDVLNKKLDDIEKIVEDQKQTLYNFNNSMSTDYAVPRWTWEYFWRDSNTQQRRIIDAITLLRKYVAKQE